MPKSKEEKIICWWSCGVTSAVACKIAIDLFGLDNCRFIFIGTNNEADDTYRFKLNCEKWYGKEIETISHSEFKTIQEVWYRFNSLNVATGAICSGTLKRDVRLKFEKENTNFKYQVYGFDIHEPKRAEAMKLNYPDSNPIFPLLMFAYSKKDCIQILTDAGIEIPMMYKLGFKNNNCFKTGCVQGGIGYWQKMKREFPEKFHTMANVEHDLTNRKGKPVTMLKDQSKAAKKSGNWQVFLVKHHDYPHLKCIDEMPECEVEPVMECNGLCGINDLQKPNKTQLQLNYE